MGDSWRFDPYKDYANDDSEESNFRRFKKSKNKHRDNDFDRSNDRDRGHGRKQKSFSRKWR